MSTAFWVLTDLDVVGQAVEVPDLVLATEFPVFQKRFTESKLVELERWGREHKDLAAQQDAFILRLLCSAYASVMKCQPPLDAAAFASQMSHAFDSLVAQRHIQYMRISSPHWGSDIQESYPITAVYQYMVSMKIHTLHIAYVPSDQ